MNRFDTEQGVYDLTNPIGAYTMIDIERVWSSGVWHYYGTFDSEPQARRWVEDAGHPWSEFRIRPK